MNGNKNKYQNIVEQLLYINLQPENFLLFQPFVAPVQTILRPVAGIKFEMS